MRLWRICRSGLAEAAFTGEGARLFGGRWNSRGVRVVYTSTSLALAAIETFVHLEPNLQPDDLIAIAAGVPDDLAIDRVALEELPRHWNRSRQEPLWRFRDDWIARGKTVALQVPSAAVEGEWNVLLNPAHPDFFRISVGKPIPFRFDARMFRK